MFVNRPSVADRIAPAPSSERAFLDEVHAFLDRALTPELREASRRTTGVYTDLAASLVWHRRLHAQGWVAPAWPRAWGGAGSHGGGGPGLARHRRRAGRADRRRRSATSRR